MQSLTNQPPSPDGSAPVSGEALYSSANYDPKDSLGRLLRRVTNSIAHDIDARMAELDLTNKQWAPLLMLQRCRCNTAAELARELEVDTGAMTRMLDRLEAKGFIRRVPSADDRRVVNLEVTPEGEHAIERVPEFLAASFNRHLAGFTVQEHETLLSMLRRMLANGGQCAFGKPAAEGGDLNPPPGPPHAGSDDT